MALMIDEAKLRVLLRKFYLRLNSDYAPTLPEAIEEIIEECKKVLTKTPFFGIIWRERKGNAKVP